MPTVTGPLYSLAASGKFGGAIDFLCNYKVRKAKFGEKKNKGAESKTTNKVTEAQSTQRTKFKEAKHYWKVYLGVDQRAAWKDFTQMVVSTGKCVGQTFKLSGYTAWMKFYLKYGEGGWSGFPDPPEDPVQE